MENKLIERAVELWCRALGNVNHDNGDISEIGVIGNVMANLNATSDSAKIDDMDKRIEKFRELLISAINKHIKEQGYHPWLDVDYSPCKILADCAEEACIPKSQFSIKSSVSFNDIYVVSSFGYGSGRTNHYLLPSGRWLVTDLTGTKDMETILTEADTENRLNLQVED